MAFGARYAGAEEYRNRVGRTDAGDDQLVIEPLLDAVSRHLTNRCGRDFNQSGSGEVVYVDGDGRDTLIVPDMAAITAIAIDESGDGAFSTAVDPTADWVQELSERDQDDPSYYAPITHGLPIVRLALLGLSTNTYGTTWPKGRRNIRLTGTRGWPAVPGEIREATIMVARHWRDAEKAGASLALPGLDADIRLVPNAFGIVRDIEARLGRRGVRIGVSGAAA